MSRTTNARGEQIVEVEINYDGNIEYPVILPVQQIQKTEPVSINDEHNYATQFSQLQDDRWGRPSLIPPKQGGATVSESDLNEDNSEEPVPQVQGQGFTEIDFDPSIPQEFINGQFTRPAGPPPSPDYTDRTGYLIPAEQNITSQTSRRGRRSSRRPPHEDIDYGLLLEQLDKGMNIWHCKLCGRLYTRRASLIDHINIHKGYKPYKCNICGSRFFYKNAYTRHTKLGCY